MQDIPYNFDKSHLVRTIDGLRLQCTAKCLAEQFEKETDRPTVFWLEFEGNNNYSNRHPLFSNQYWITIKHQEEQSEYERLILAGLYKGVLDRKRLLWAMPNADYLKKIVTEYTKECRKSAYDMITAINAFVTTIDTELYLNPRGFQTSHAAHEKLLKARIDGLKEYIDLQTANQRRYIWYRETKIFNLLNFANVARVSEKYKYRIEKMINRIYPKSARDEYKCEISNVIDSVKTAYNEYTEDNIESVHEKLLASIIESFELTDILNARRYDVLESEIGIPMATGAKVYSFIPKEIENQGFLARSMKYVRKMISMIQEYTDIADMNRLQYNVGAALIDSKRSCACANGNKQSGYYISFMIGMFDR